VPFFCVFSPAPPPYPPPRRAAAADVLGTPAEISGALNRIGIHVPRGTITSWASRGRLTARPNGLFALSDVLALHAQSKTRR
jgi:hypothetical protein